MTTTERPIDEYVIDASAGTTASARTWTLGNGSVPPQADRPPPNVVDNESDDEQERPLTMHWSAVGGALVAHWAATPSRFE